jgi:hypothetical protein
MAFCHLELVVRIRQDRIVAAGGMDTVPSIGPGPALGGRAGSSGRRCRSLGRRTNRVG